MIVKFYKSQEVWLYTDGLTEAIKTAPSGHYRRMIIDGKVAIYGKDSVFSLFKTKYVKITDIQKSETTGDNYASETEFKNETREFFLSTNYHGGFIVTDTVSTYAALPSDGAAHSGEIWNVGNGSGGALAWLGVYKYPKGFYSPNSSDVWEQVPFNIKVSEDALTLVNISNWSEYIAYAQDIFTGDRVNYLTNIYENKTGAQTSTAPDTDTTNWAVISDGSLGAEKEAEGVNGFDREAMLAGSKEMGIVEYCYNAASGIVHVIGSEKVSVANTNNFKTETSRTTFADGSALTNFTLCHTPDPTMSYFQYWKKGVLVKISGTKKLVTSDEFKGYVYYNDSDVLVANATLGTGDLIKNTVLVVQIYINKHLSKLIWYADERHGILQDGETHLQQHGFPGFFRNFGLNATGFVIGASTFTSVSMSVCNDEDIAQLILEHTAIPKMYVVGANHEYTFDDDDNTYAKFDAGIATWNDVSGATAVLTQITGNDRSNATLVACNNKLAPLVTIVGQELYNNSGEARDKADSAWNRLSLEGLPSHEYTRIFMCIIKANGQIVAGETGETGWDYRQGFPAKYFE